MPEVTEKHKLMDLLNWHLLNRITRNLKFTATNVARKATPFIPALSTTGKKKGEFKSADHKMSQKPSPRPGRISSKKEEQAK